MPYGNKARFVSGYQFGADPPTVGLEAAKDQEYLKVHFWNLIARIEIKHRERRDSYVKPLYDQGMTKKAVYETCGAVALEDQRKALRLKARREYASFGLFWGNAMMVERSADAARNKPSGLKFHAYNNDQGSVSVVYTNGLPLEQLWGANNKCQIVPVPADTYDSRRGRRRQQRTTMKLWLGKDEHGNAQYLEAPVYLHRKLPNGLVRAVTFHWYKVGRHMRYNFNISLETEAPKKKTGCGHVAVDVGWRKLPSGDLRVAYWANTTGESGELILPKRWLEAMTKCDDLVGIRMQYFNTVKQSLATYIINVSDPPAWLVSNADGLSQWLEVKRMVNLYEQWKDHRFHADEAGFAMLETWYKRESHLHDYQANMREQLLYERREIFRCFAATLVRHHDTLILEAFDLRVVSERDKQGGDLPPAARHYRSLANVSGLRLALSNAFRREGGTTVLRDPANSTHLCNVCQTLNKFDAAKYLVHTCVSCGTVWDQDRNASINLLREPPSPALGPEASRKSKKPVKACETRFSLQNTGSNDKIHVRTALG